MKWRMALPSGALFLLTVAGPAFGQDVTVITQDADVISGDTGSGSSESNNNRDVDQSQDMDVDNSDNGDVTVSQGGQTATAENNNNGGGEAAIAYAPITTQAPIAAGPVASPPIVVAHNDILSNTGNRYEQSQSYSDSSSFDDDHSDNSTVINRSFNDNEDSFNGAAFVFGRGNSVNRTSASPVDELELVRATRRSDPKTLPVTGHNHTISMLALGILALVAGLWLNHLGWMRQNDIGSASIAGLATPDGVISAGASAQRWTTKAGNRIRDFFMGVSEAFKVVAWRAFGLGS